jgi:hypothetical protein
MDFTVEESNLSNGQCSEGLADLYPQIPSGTNPITSRDLSSTPNFDRCAQHGRSAEASAQHSTSVIPIHRTKWRRGEGEKKIGE